MRVFSTADKGLLVVMSAHWSLEKIDALLAADRDATLAALMNAVETQETILCHPALNAKGHEVIGGVILIYELMHVWCGHHAGIITVDQETLKLIPGRILEMQTRLKGLRGTDENGCYSGDICIQRPPTAPVPEAVPVYGWGSDKGAVN